MSFFIHIGSAIVFLLMLHIGRRFVHQRQFLVQLIRTRARWYRPPVFADLPLSFLREFTAVLAIPFNANTRLPDTVIRIDASILLDFYLENGIQSISVQGTKGEATVSIVPINQPDESYDPATLRAVFDDKIAITLSGAR